MQHSITDDFGQCVPGWLPRSVLIYVLNEKCRISMRKIARHMNVQTSTVSRNVRTVHNKLSDPLYNAGVERLSNALAKSGFQNTALEVRTNSTSQTHPEQFVFQPKEDKLKVDGKKLFKALALPNAVLSVSLNSESVSVTGKQGCEPSARYSTFDRSLAEAFVLRDMIQLNGSATQLKYSITSKGKSYFERFSEFYLKNTCQNLGLKDCGKVEACRETQLANLEQSAIEKSPLYTLLRLRDKFGERYLSPNHVVAGQIFREDYEVSNLLNARHAKKTKTGLEQKDVVGEAFCLGASERFELANKMLGPIMSDVVIRCCCHFQGLGKIERHLGWSARSGKVVLRIALTQLAEFYRTTDEIGGANKPLLNHLDRQTVRTNTR